MSLLVTCVILVLAGIGALYWLRGHVVRVRISGASMQPTFNPGQHVLAWRTAPAAIRTGDIVVVESPRMRADELRARMSRISRTYEVVDWDEPTVPADPDEKHWVIKRVAAVPGEPVPFDIPGRAGDRVVPPGSLVLIGDNQDQSVDSRHHGYVSTERVLGKVVRSKQGR